MQDPDTIDPVHVSIYDLRKSKDYWLFSGRRAYHDGREQILSISTLDLIEGNSIGCCITRGSDLDFFINGQKSTVGWHNVPVDKPLWGVVYMHEFARTIQSEFYCGELYSCEFYSVSPSCMCMHVHIHM